MSVLLIFENKDVAPWVEALQEKLPEAIIEVYPNIKNNSAIEFIICWKPQKDIVKQFPNVKVIQSVGASVDHIINTQDVGEEIVITRIVDDQLSNDMWEFLITVVLTELKNMSVYLQQRNDKNWQQHQYQSMSSTTISILGLGNIGGYVASRFAQLGFKVKGWSNSKKEIENVKSFSGEKELEGFLIDADFLINLLPLTSKTKDLINKDLLQCLPQSSFLINVGRGEHVVESDLVALLDESKLSGALLDVFREEPLPKEHPFWSHPKIKITPHVASLTDIESAIDQIVENYNRFLKKEELLNVVSLKKGY